MFIHLGHGRCVRVCLCVPCSIFLVDEGSKLYFVFSLISSFSFCSLKLLKLQFSKWEMTTVWQGCACLFKMCPFYQGLSVGPQLHTSKKKKNKTSYLRDSYIPWAFSTPCWQKLKQPPTLFYKSMDVIVVMFIFLKPMKNRMLLNAFP